VNYPTVSAPMADANGIYWGNTTDGFKQIYADGSQDVFGLCFYAYPPSDTSFNWETTAHALLTKRIDPQGRATLIGYEQVAFTNWWNFPYPFEHNAYRVKYVVDTEGRTNTFLYNTNILLSHQFKLTSPQQ
jgi:hypothetical protein